MNRHLSKWIWTFLLTPGLVLAGPSSDLETYVQLALDQNAELAAWHQRHLAAREEIGQAGKLPDPALTYGGFIRSIETRVGPQKHKFGLSQTLPWFGTLGLEENIARDRAKILKTEVQGKAHFLIREVRHAYYDYYLLGRTLSIVSQTTALLKNWVQITQTRYRAGIGGYADVIRGQIEWEQIQEELKELEDGRMTHLSRFNALLHRNPEHPIPWPKEIAPPSQPLSDDQLLVLGLKGNPQLHLTRHASALESKRRGLAVKKGLPDFRLGLEYILTGDSQNPIPDSGQDAIFASVMVRLPLWRGAYSSSVKAVERKETAVEKEREAKEDQLSFQLQKASADWKESARKVSLYDQSLIPKSEQAIRAVKRAYEAGNASFLDLVETERLRLNFRLAHEKAHVKAKKAEATLDMLTGSLEPISNVKER